MNGINNGHLTIEQWRQYIRNEMTPAERERADQELLVCEGCMWLFMEAMEESEQSGAEHRPGMELPDMVRLEEQVIAELQVGEPLKALKPIGDPAEETSCNPAPPQTMTEVRQLKRRDSWLQHPVTHYTLAASITLLLMATGALTGFSEKLQHLEQHEPESQTIGAEWMSSEPSWSDRLVDKAGSFLDGVQAWRFK
ncbi:hypothetical protein D3P08_17435 [Paenibacillus nanensis]|uniref:Zf-HC2 domain-containing protein n=1 Tax=Paenibacillus nanensis TaxID=393251 RepID=A0A3A1V118_9BACL|nr:hypothetical protein [Paenibacillus nanensis]RIX51250.1 hypothetical protein D3P08_17435 [Paenibacillus nanensis]